MGLRPIRAGTTKTMSEPPWFFLVLVSNSPNCWAEISAKATVISARFRRSRRENVSVAPDDTTVGLSLILQ